MENQALDNMASEKFRVGRENGPMFTPRIATTDCPEIP